MRAAVVRRAGQPLSIERVPDPAPGPGDVVLKVARCGVCGSDLQRTEAGLGDFAYQPGDIMGHEFSGEVVALGADVSRLRVGDRVAPLPIMGCGNCANCLVGQSLWCANVRMGGKAYAEYTIAGQNECLKLPEGLSWGEGALIEPIAVGLHGASLAAITPRVRVLVLGAGPIALAATYWARRFGAGSVAAVARSNRRRDLALKLGATSFLTTGTDLPERASAELGGPPDVVFEGVGGTGMIEQAANCVGPRGSVIVLGACWTPDPWLPVTALFKEVRVHFSMMYGMRDYELVADVLRSGETSFGAMITDTVSFEQFPAAFEALRASRTQVKLMLDPWQ
ncbi:MAG TPA: alcohol dehydrogenase catalytic domain-containing protein [Candidatus Binataceae bacterium]|nr:alcohol dehydrogenase catalytic domain-containing protein [Candidatus Binataceae bacterium]